MSKILGYLLLSVGGAVLLVNVYGEFRGMRAAERVPEDSLRFRDDIVLSLESTLAEVERRDHEGVSDYVKRVTTVVQQGMAHLDGWYDHPVDRFDQRVPFRENFLLNLLGRYSGLPQMERYHFSDYRRSLERGIGLCGDHAMILSQILDEQGIENELLSFNGHVVVEVRAADGFAGVFDADFGVSMVGADRHALQDPRVIDIAYAAESYSPIEIDALTKVYQSSYSVFGSTYEFMRKRYVFERVSYVLKWALPLAMIAVGVLCLRYRRSVKIGVPGLADRTVAI